MPLGGVEITENDDISSLSEEDDSDTSSLAKRKKEEKLRAPSSFDAMMRQASIFLT